MTIDLIVAQPTPFCNLACDYCYLPNKNSKELMKPNILKSLFQNIDASELISKEVTICWHGGEPMTAGIEFFQNAIDIKKQITNKKLRFNIQTNGTLIDENWARFFKENSIQIGISLDGPKEINDSYRVNRIGAGSFEKVMQSIKILNQFDIDYSVIAVVTSKSVNKASEVFNFFKENSIKRIGFNFDEIEGVNATSTVIDIGAARKFWDEMIFAWNSDGRNIVVREFDSLIRAIYYKSDNGDTTNRMATPLRILTVGYDGSITTFSPEIHGQMIYGKKLVFGNVMNDRFEDISNNVLFKKIHNEIDSGCSKCEQQCGYFDLCNGGSPSNKYFENKTFDSTITINCQVYRMALIDSMLEFLGNLQ